MGAQHRTVTIHFAIEGLARSADADQIVQELGSRFASSACDPARAIFTVALDPAIHSFDDVRAAVRAFGARRSRQYLAVVMSP
jgi:hypothetical protein